jgi:hypothetical protein
VVVVVVVKNVIFILREGSSAINDTRYKLRYCVRASCYRFTFEAEALTQAWKHFKGVFGEDKYIEEFDIFEIENDFFQLRAFFNTKTMTVLEKKKYSIEIEEQVFSIIGYKR